MTLQILAETKVGVHVRNAQKQYKDNEIIVDAAKNLISKWKEIADAEKKAKPKESAKEDQPSATSDLEKPSIKLTLNTDVIPSSSSGSSSSLENPDQDRSGSANSSPRGAATPVSPGGGFHDMFDDAELEKCFAALPQSRKNVRLSFISFLFSAYILFTDAFTPCGVDNGHYYWPFGEGFE